MTKYTTQSNAWIYGDVDDWFDCDFASMVNHLKIKNDDLGEPYHVVTQEDSVSNPGNEGYDETLSVTSGQYSSLCVGNGSQFSCSTRIDSQVYIVSEANATAMQTQFAPGCLYILRPCGP